MTPPLDPTEIRRAWARAIAGEPSAHGPATLWSTALRGDLPGALEGLNALPQDPVTTPLQDAVTGWTHPHVPPLALPAPHDAVARWAHAVSAMARGRPLPPAPPGDDALRAEHLRLLAAPDPGPRATAQLRRLSQRTDAVGARATLDLGARTPDRLLATRLLADGLARARALGQRLTVAHALRLLARRAVQDGRPAEAIPLLHRALKLDALSSALVDELQTRRQLDEALTALGREEPRLDALVAWKTAASRARAPDLEAWIDSAIGQTALRTRRHHQAIHAFERAACHARQVEDFESLRADLEGLVAAAQAGERHDTQVRAQRELDALPDVR